jgi:4-amino-4-deoxy-L-arabinose transferase-like glycosyltransferase
MTRQKLFGSIALTLLILIWIHQLARMPTLDLDESLYRAVSQSMKTKGDPWLLNWDSRPLFHKPPIFYWLIVATSTLLDSGKEVVSSLASRIPSVLSSIGILFSLRAGMKYILPGPVSRESKSIPVLAFLCASFAVLTSSAVIFDPLQTLALMPALLIPTRIFLRDENPQRKTWFFFGASLALATMIKGLNGILIPSFAFGLHLLFSLPRWGFQRILRTGLSFFAFSFAPAAILSGAYFFLLDRKIGPEFTEEFFWVQHFGRSRSPMEAHSGGILYHPLVLFLGGGFLTPLIFSLWRDRRPDWIRFGFPISFAFAFVLAFSLSATKLPHYTWPVWPALALFVGLIHSLPSRENAKPGTWFSRLEIPGLFFSLPVFLLGILLLALGAASDLVLNELSDSPRSQLLLHSLVPFNGIEKAFFWVGTISCFIFIFRHRTLSRSPHFAAFLSMTSVSALVIGLSPSIEGILVKPFVQIAEDLKARNPAASECIRYSGPLSATLSLALGPKLFHNRCEPQETKFLITPEWKAAECQEAGFTEISHRGHLILCVKSIEPTK